MLSISSVIKLHFSFNTRVEVHTAVHMAKIALNHSDYYRTKVSKIKELFKCIKQINKNKVSVQIPMLLPPYFLFLLNCRYFEELKQITKKTSNTQKWRLLKNNKKQNMLVPPFFVYLKPKKQKKRKCEEANFRTHCHCRYPNLICRSTTL